MPTWRTETFNTGASGSTPTVTVPTGLADGDIALIGMVVSGSANPDTNKPAGWVLIASHVSFTNPRVYVFRKVITNAAGEGSTWTWGATLAAAYGWRATAMAGGDTTTPEDATPTQNSSATNISPITVSITPGTTGGGLWSIVAANTSTRTITDQSSPWINGAEQGERKNQAAWRDSTGTGSQSVDWTFSGSATNQIAIMVALKIAVGGVTLVMPAATATAEAPVPGVRVSSAPPSATATADAPAPTLRATVPAPAATADGSASSPVIGPLRVPAPVADASADAPVPAIRVSIPAPPSTATADATPPGIRVLIIQATATATAEAYPPIINGGGGGITLQPPAAVATAEAIVPVIQIRNAMPPAQATGDAIAPLFQVRAVMPAASADAAAIVPILQRIITIAVATATADAYPPQVLSSVNIVAPAATASAEAYPPTVLNRIASVVATATGQAIPPGIWILLVMPAAAATGLAPATNVSVGLIIPRLSGSVSLARSLSGSVVAAGELSGAVSIARELVGSVEE